MHIFTAGIFISIHLGIRLVLTNENRTANYQGQFGTVLNTKLLIVMKHNCRNILSTHLEPGCEQAFQERIAAV